MKSNAKSVEEYLSQLPYGQGEALGRVREIICKNLPEGVEEALDFGMIVYSIPLSTFPGTYNGKPLMVAGLAAQKNYMAVYLMSVYGDRKTKEWFEDAWGKSGKKRDMGKSCIRFKKLEDLPLNVLGEAIGRVSVREFLAKYKAVHKKKR